MNRKGTVSSYDGTRRVARILFPDLGDTVSPELPYAAHISAVDVGDQVAVMFFSENLSDGLIVALEVT